MLKILENYMQILLEQFQYDVQIMSQPWMYFCLMIPATAYFIFAVIKWSFLTLPISCLFIRPLQLLNSSVKAEKSNKKD